MLLESKVPSEDEQENKIFIHDAPLLIVLGILAFIFQVVSAWTEYIGLKTALSDYIGEQMGNIVSFIIAFSIEFGVLYLVTYIVNVIYDEYLTDKEFTKKQRRANKVKFAQMAFLLVGLTGVSMFLSKNNVRLALKANPVKPKIEDTSHFNEEEEQRTGSVLALYESDKKELESLERNSRKSIKNSYTAKIAAIEQDIDVLKDKEQRTGKRYTTRKAKLNQEIAMLKTEEASEQAIIDQQAQDKKSKLLDKRDQGIAKIEKDISSRKDPIIKRNTSIIGNNEDYANNLANFLSLYAQFAVIGFLIVWTWICISLNTCGIKPKLFIPKEFFESSIIKELWILISTKMSRGIRNGIRKRLLKIKPLKTLEESEAIFTVSSNRPPLAVAYNSNDDKRRQIGFKIGQQKPNNSPTETENGSYVNTLSLDDLSSTSKNHQTIVVEKVVEKIVYVDNQDTKNCLNCGESFTYKNKKKTYCSTKCRMSYWEQKNGKVLKRGKQKSNNQSKQS